MNSTIKLDRKIVSLRGIKQLDSLRDYVEKRKSKKTNEFLEFYEFNKEDIMKALYNACASIPSSMNNLDYRMDIGKVTARALVKAFPEFERVQNQSYDLVFHGKRKKYFISLKSKCRIFQKVKKNGKLGVSHYICVMNRQRSQNTLAGKQWDYLIGIQRQSKMDSVNFGIGLVSFPKVKIAVEAVKNQVAEVKFRLRDKDWDKLDIDSKFRKEKKSNLDKKYNRDFDRIIDNLLKAK